MEIIKTRESIKKFSEGMELTLQKHDEEKGKDGWLGTDTSVKFLLDRAHEKLYELTCAYENCDPHQVMKKCLGVANFMMGGSFVRPVSANVCSDCRGSRHTF